MNSEGMADRTVLVTVDSLRYDAYSLMENTREFVGDSHPQAFATSTTTALSFQSIIGGVMPGDPGLADGQSVVTEFDTDSCFTAGYQSNPLLTTKYGYGQGFDVYSESEREWSWKDRVATWLPFHENPIYTVGSRVLNGYERLLGAVREPEREYTSVHTLVDEAIEDVTAQGDPTESEWFIWIHVMEPHHPYNPPEDRSGVSRGRAQRLTRQALAGNLSDSDVETLQHLYEDEVRETDEALARLWEWTPDDARVVFCADHGDYLGEDGRWGHFDEFGSEVVHVPFATRNAPEPNGDVVSIVDVPSVLVGTEYGRGTFDREFAFAARNRRTLATDGHVLVSDDGTEWLTDTPDSAREARVNRERARFERRLEDIDVEGSVDMQDLEDLGYV